MQSNQFKKFLIFVTDHQNVKKLRSL